MYNELVINFYLTYKCNLSCEYCPVVYDYDNYIYKDIFLNNIFFDFIKKFNFKNNNIEFFGGEPLLRKKFIYKFINFFGENFYYKITTNGLLLDKIMLDVLNEINISIHISSYKKLLDKIELFKNYKEKISFIFVIDKFNIEEYKKIFYTLYYNGFKNFSILPVYLLYNWNNSELISLYNFVSYLKSFNDLNLDFLYYEFLKGDIEFSIDFEGNIYSFTGEVIFSKKISDKFYIDNLQNILGNNSKEKEKITIIKEQYKKINNMNSQENSNLRGSLNFGQSRENFLLVNNFLKVLEKL